MEAALNFISIVIIIFGVLQIILFFKLWIMTGDVKDIKNIIKAHLSNPRATNSQNECYSQEKNDGIENDKKEITNIDDIAIGDNVTRLSDNKQMIVDSVNGDKYFCKVSFFEGYKYFNRNEIKKQ